MTIPKVAAIHDLSCYGRAALTTVIPIISAMGAQVCPLPTALLSTHTGGFDGFTFLDLTDQLEKIIDHWKTLDLSFAAIYSGYLGSAQQIEIVRQMIDHYQAEDPLIIVDPVMADHGRVYEGISSDHVQQMRSLIQKADIITPNLTEAFLLTNRPYQAYVTKQEVEALLLEIAGQGCPNVVITSVFESEQEDKIGDYIYQQETDSLSFIRTPKIPAHFTGTGDTFTSVLVGSMIQGLSVGQSVQAASDFVYHCMQMSQKLDQIDVRNDLQLENQLFRLWKGK